MPRVPIANRNRPINSLGIDMNARDATAYEGKETILRVTDRYLNLFFRI